MKIIINGRLLKCKIIVYPLHFLIVAFVLLIPQTLHAQITVTSNSLEIGKYDVFELSINHPVSYNNNWEDVSVSAEFSGPDDIHIDGFYYESNVWKIRFAPPQTGKWTYTIIFKTPSAEVRDSGIFTCLNSNNKGFLKRHPSNPFRLVFADGSLFNSVGIEDCIQDFNGNGTPLDDFGFDGELITDTYKGRLTDLKTYLDAYGKNGAGFNLFRWTTDNCSFKLYNTISVTGNTYLTREGMFGDTLVRSLKDNKLRIWLTFFGPPVFSDLRTGDSAEKDAVERYVKYVVARYGAYVDIWELFNESSASDEYYPSITAYIRSIDPYKRLISVSDERPKLASIDINSPHWYEKESELDSDERAATMINSRKSEKKPIMFGEQGNSVQNWDVLSALRMRLRSWVAFFSEGTLIFWNTSFSKSYMHAKSANQYIGPTERGFIKALQDYSALADSSVVPFVVKPTNSNAVRAYGLGSNNVLFGYFHHYNNHLTSIVTSFKIRVKRSAVIYWINPVDNTIVTSALLSYGTQLISSPPFNIDLAMRIVYNDTFTSADLQKPLEIVVYPNPAATLVALNGNFEGAATISLYDTSGKRVLNNVQVVNDQKINIGTISSGVYIYTINTANRQVTGKLVISR